MKVNTMHLQCPPEMKVWSASRLFQSQKSVSAMCVHCPGYGYGYWMCVIVTFNSTSSNFLNLKLCNGAGDVLLHPGPD